MSSGTIDPLSDFSLVPFTEVIPHFWREEILESPLESPLKKPVMYAVMQGYGSLACLLFTRIMRMCKDCREDRGLVKELRLIYSINLMTMKGLSQRRQSV